MPHITSVLGNEPGIQYDRPNDKTGGTGTAPINNVIVGSFKRGRTDQMMDITKQNIRAKLGYEPDNPDYVAVQDALDTNIPSVKVIRIADGCTPTTFSFVPTVFGNNAVLEYELISPNEETIYGRIVESGITANELAKRLFLYSGTDLMRQNNMNLYFDYSPYQNIPDAPNNVITISGRAALPVSPIIVDNNFEETNYSATLVLKKAQYLEPDEIDYVSLQFGKEVKIHSCTMRVSIVA